VLGGQTNMTASSSGSAATAHLNLARSRGLSPRTEAIEQVLRIERLNGKLGPNIMTNMWAKFAAICGAGVFSVVRGNAEILRRAPETLELIWQATAEGVAVAQAKGIPLDSSVVEMIKRMINSVSSRITKSNRHYTEDSYTEDAIMDSTFQPHRQPGCKHTGVSKSCQIRLKGHPEEANLLKQNQVLVNATALLMLLVPGVPSTSRFL
jgi:hypothetical protein